MICSRVCLQDHVTSGLASSLSAMQSLGGFHSMAAAAAAGIPHHHLMASAAAAAAAASNVAAAVGGGNGGGGRDEQTDVLGSAGHHLGAPLHDYHHL